MIKTTATAYVRIPSATYRLQFNRDFTFKLATDLIGYLDEMGISDCYASPLLAARPGSNHGYDVVDHSRLNPELGTRAEFDEFTCRLGDRNMGLIMDVVPNHVCIAGARNKWFRDILENGCGSPYARFFDIAWDPAKESLKNKVLLPMLGDQYGRVLENKEIQLAYQRGAFVLEVNDTRLPIAPRTTIPILAQLLELLSPEPQDSDRYRVELESIMTALSHLPPRTETDPEKVRERTREKGVIRGRMAALTGQSRPVRAALRTVIQMFNGIRGIPGTFDQLDRLLGEQVYRLSFWRVAADEINYRRFFDVNDLAAIRVEEPAVFAAVHDLTFRLMAEGRVTGLRVDHIDGLYDPEQYLRDVRLGCLSALQKLGSASGGPSSAQARSTWADGGGAACYLVVEKILARDESLPRHWETHGTTGYDFLNLVNGLFVETGNGMAFEKLYNRFTGVRWKYSDVAYESKKLVLLTALSSELHALARRLERISDCDRNWRDFTLKGLEYALGEVIACFPAYRTYIRPTGPETSDPDRRNIALATRAAIRRNPAVSLSIFNFIRSVLLMDGNGGSGGKRSRTVDETEFVMSFQQLTGPVAAKGIEDTAFYRFYPLSSLCEVGGDPSRFGVSAETFHDQSQQRQKSFPHTMLTTSTHDTKRSEDVRARINVLSEIPVRWYRAARRWQNLNHDLKPVLDGQAVPDANEEYLLYQTLIGAWPTPGSGLVAESFLRRIQDYMLKAMREAKFHSSWLSPNEEYEQAVFEFIRRILTPEASFLDDFVEFQAPIARAGTFNSVSQTLLKIASPGVPDFYQGTEMLDLSLVDPDNRRPVDFTARRQLLASLQRADLSELIKTPEDGRLKLFVTARALNHRRQRRGLFDEGEYLSVFAEGTHRRNVVSFARKNESGSVIVVAARFFTTLAANSHPPLGGDAWADTFLALPSELSCCYRDVFTGRPIRSESARLRLAEVLGDLPVALLDSGEASI
jgi:(1->4)-alpha-D-glucan 1-alpha-D-glucosylmutase